MELAGFSDDAVRDYEVRHRALSRRAAAEGMVLLKNEQHVLPLKTGQKVALYGPGAIATVRGGSGSGSVNARRTVSVRQGLEEAGLSLCSLLWLDSYAAQYEAARREWKEAFWKRMDSLRAQYPDGDYGQAFFQAYAETPFRMPKGDDPAKTDAETAIYVLSRSSGEGSDRKNEPGDYQLSKEEHRFLQELNDLYSSVILLLNTGGIIDLSILDELPNIQAVLLMGQPGSEAGYAVSDALMGKVNPSGKLTDTWARRYEEYPSSSVFSDQDGNVSDEPYEEGIFVGYRYFDTFEKPVRYGFGYGLSYTSFDMALQKIEAGRSSVSVSARVKNTGMAYGSDVVQLYASCADESREYRRLAGFQKTDVIAPGETVEISIELPLERLARFEKSEASWVIDAGDILLFAGDSLESSKVQALIHVPVRLVLEKGKSLFAGDKERRELTGPQDRTAVRRSEAAASFRDSPYAGNVVELPADYTTRTVVYDSGYDALPEEIRKQAAALSDEQLVHLAAGAPQTVDFLPLDSQCEVPGSAGETSSCALAEGIEPLVLADGPAGLRLSKQYQVVDGHAVPTAMSENMDDGALDRNERPKDAVYRYQFCTAFPIGTQLAETWDTALVEEVGRSVAEEMELFHVQLWLAPGMNIHRNPLCGRNYEYYSEDPLVSGKMAAAITRGVQSKPDCGTTIKHFACNNQENNRFHYNAQVSECALREIYLKGFEIAVKESQPASIMTSYNKINGVHTAVSFDLCTSVLRCEWGFEGAVMTDWTSTWNDPECTADAAIRAGNDLMMPGSAQDLEVMAGALADGSLSRKDLERSVGHLIRVIHRLKA